MRDAGTREGAAHRAPGAPLQGAGHGHLGEVATLFLRLGCTAFGGPAAHIAMMRREMVERRGWLTDRRFADLLGIINLIPGPNSTELAIYLGYLRAGWLGLLLSGICFIGPAMLLVLALAALYVRFGAVPQVGWVLYGIQPVVAAIIAQALFGLSQTVLRGILPVVCAAGVAVLFLLGVNPLPLLFGGGLAFVLARLLLARSGANGTGKQALLPALTLSSRETGAATLASAAAAVPLSQVTLFLTFLKIGAVLYGSGYVLLAFLRADFVQHLGWLSDRQLLDAVSVGQFTPGPVFTTATFIGYLVGGWQGALLATLAIFLPSFVFVGLIRGVAERLRRSPVTALLLDGVSIAALALMAGVLVQLGATALRDPLTWGLALAAFAVLLRFKVNSAWLILAGALTGLVAKSLLHV
jgi:chromate transporter